MSDRKAVFMNHWKLALEEDGESGRALMRICGPGPDGRWFRSAPVRIIDLDPEGWRAYTEKNGERYVLKFSLSQKAGSDRMWGKEREQWNLLAEKLPFGLRVFARLWEDMPLVFDDAKRLEDLKMLEKWKDRYGLEENLEILYSHARHIGGIRFDLAGREKVAPRERQMLETEGIFLYLDEEKLCCKGAFYTGRGTGIQMEWSYISQEIRPNEPSRICARSKWTYCGSPRQLYLDISYRYLGAGRVELLASASKSFLPEKVSYYEWTPEERKTPEELFGKRLYLSNAGKRDLLVKMDRQGDGEEILLHSFDKVEINPAVLVCGKEHTQPEKKNEREISVSRLEGKTIIKLEQRNGWRELWFFCSDGTVYAFYPVYYREDLLWGLNYYLEDVEGDMACLLDTPILQAEKIRTETGMEEGFKDVFYEWTVYRILTKKGQVKLRFLGTSEGEGPLHMGFFGIPRETLGESVRYEAERTVFCRLDAPGRILKICLPRWAREYGFCLEYEVDAYAFEFNPSLRDMKARLKMWLDQVFFPVEGEDLIRDPVERAEFIERIRRCAYRIEREFPGMPVCMEQGRLL